METQIVKKVRKPNIVTEMIGNLVFVYRDANSVYGGYRLMVPTYVLLSVLGPLAMVFALPLAVGTISSGGSIGAFVTAMAVTVGIYAVLTFFQQLAYTRMDMTNTMVRLARGWPTFLEKCLTMDFDLFEPGEYTKRRTAAERALDGNWMGYEMMLKGFPALLSGFLGIVVYSIWSAFASGWIFLVLIGMTVFHIGLTVFARRLADRQQDKEDHTDTVSRYFRRISEDAEAGKDIRNYGLQDFIIGKKEEATKANARLETKVGLAYSLPAASDAVFMLVRDIIAYAILTSLYLGGSLDLYGFTLMIGIVTGYSAFLSTAVDNFSSLTYASALVTKLRDYIDTPNDMNHVAKTDLKALKAPWAISFRNVSFKYPGSDKWIVRNLNLDIKAGERLALVGVNGAGKSTLVKLLSGLYYPTEGEIAINGVSIKDFDIMAYHDAVSVINQDSKPFPFSIRENITGGDKDFDAVRFRACVDQAGLTADIAALSAKENTYLTRDLDDKGVLLSGGQMQKLYLARALYKNGTLLVLDEPTAALDPIAESALYEEYRDLTQGKTSVFISHRLASTRFCDRIILLEKGRIVEAGTHEELLRKKGKYAAMFAVQAHYYQENGKEEEDI